MKHYLLVLAVSSLQAQNLVQNPGFEELIRKPEKGHTNIGCCKYWYSPGSSGSDYFTTAYGFDDGVPRNTYGKQEPHGGKAYAGVCIHKSYIEYLGTKLSEPLIAEKNYLVEMYISRAEKSIAPTREFGVLLTEKPVKAMASTGFSMEPSLTFKFDEGTKEEKDWIRLSATYQAQGGEIFLTLGHFTYNRPDGVLLFSHHYIDDVSVTAIEDGPVVDATEPLPEEKTEKQEDPPVFSPPANARIVLENIFFDTGKSELLERSYNELGMLLSYLASHPEFDILIEGFTDSAGNEKQNLALSEQRAKAVADYLTQEGISASRVQYAGYGKDKPIADNSSEAGRQKNRRVEFKLVTR